MAPIQVLIERSFATEWEPVTNKILVKIVLNFNLLIKKLFNIKKRLQKLDHSTIIIYHPNKKNEKETQGEMVYDL